MFKYHFHTALIAVGFSLNSCYFFQANNIALHFILFIFCSVLACYNLYYINLKNVSLNSFTNWRFFFTSVPLSISAFLFLTYFQYHKSYILIPVSLLSICYFAISFFRLRKNHFFYILKWFLLLSIWFLFTIYFPIVYSENKFEFTSNIAGNLCLLFLSILLCEYDTDSKAQKKSIINFLSIFIYLLAIITAMFQFLRGDIFPASLYCFIVTLLLYIIYKQATILLQHKKRNLIADLILLYYIVLMNLYNFFYIS